MSTKNNIKSDIYSDYLEFILIMSESGLKNILIKHFIVLLLLFFYLRSWRVFVCASRSGFFLSLGGLRCFQGVEIRLEIGEGLRYKTLQVSEVLSIKSFRIMYKQVFHRNPRGPNPEISCLKKENAGDVQGCRQVRSPGVIAYIKATITICCN